jgi:hypothetical protein
VVFIVGITHEDLVSLFLVILRLKICRKPSDLVVFIVPQVLEVDAQVLRFLMIEYILGV